MVGFGPDPGRAVDRQARLLVLRDIRWPRNLYTYTTNAIDMATPYVSDSNRCRLARVGVPSHRYTRPGPIEGRTPDVISDFTSDSMLECLLPERALKEGKTFSDMANELVEIGLFDLKEAEE